MRRFLFLMLYMGMFFPTAVNAEVNQIRKPYLIGAVKIFRVEHDKTSRPSQPSNGFPKIKVRTYRGDSQRNVIEKWSYSKSKNYIDKGAICIDKEDGDISTMVEISGDVVNLSKPGTYLVKYNCMDSEGNKAKERTRTVLVEKGKLL